MCDEWMPGLQLKLSRDEFQRLPRHAAYRYEYRDGTAILSPWPHHAHARLDLARCPPGRADGISIRAMRPEDQAPLADVFVAAFRHVQPFGSLDDDVLRQAACQCLQRACGGGDGPWIEAASFVAQGAQEILGTALLTLLPGGDPKHRDSYHWRDRAPTGLWDEGKGQPHLTWLFVSPFYRRAGVAGSLLQACAQVLRERGYASLWTTFLVGNDASILWHWRHGFVLDPR